MNRNKNCDPLSSQLDDSASLMVKSETDGTILLDSEIRNDTNYSKQQETLIVWSEDNSDLALSFQEKNGCEEIWERICQQQVKSCSSTINHVMQSY